MKKTIIRIVIVLLAVVLVAAAVLIFFGLRQGIRFSQAQYIETAHGHMLLIDGSPVSMSGKDSLFKKLTSGDKVLVAHGLIAETYPGQAKAYLCIKQSDGTEADIPADILDSLRDMGWLAERQTEEGKTVTYEYGCVTMSLKIPKSWESQTLQPAEGLTMYGIVFGPKGSEATMALCGYPDGVGFCGTDITFVDTTVAGYPASVAYYHMDGLDRLDHIYFTDISGDFAFINQGLSSYWEQYGEQIMQIAETVEIQVDTISQEEALALAEAQFPAEYESASQQLEHQSGNWTVIFRGGNRQLLGTVTVTADGQIGAVSLPEPTDSE